MAKRKPGKAAYGGGSIYPSQDGTFIVAVRPRKGAKPLRRTAPDREAAEILRAELVRQRDEGVDIEQGSQLFEDFTDYWYNEVYLQRGRSERQDKHTLDMLELHLLPTLGRRTLMEISHAECQQLINDLRRRPKPKRPLSPQTIHHVYSVMKQVFEKAATMGYVQRDPTIGLELPEINRAQKPPPALGHVQRLLEIVEEHRAGIVFHLMATLGLRLGEALAIRRIDFNEDCSELWIRQALNYHTAKAGTPKRESVRLLAVPSRLAARCRAHWSMVLRQQADSGPDFANLGIFCPSEVGTPIEPRNFERIWSGQTKKVGRKKEPKFFPGMKQRAGFPEEAVLHDLRAWTATMLVDVDAPSVVIGHVLGHGAKNVTEQYMRRHLPTMRRSLEKLETVLWGAIDSGIDSSTNENASGADASKAS
jgi:integrase